MLVNTRQLIHAGITVNFFNYGPMLKKMSFISLTQNFIITANKLTTLLALYNVSYIAILYIYSISVCLVLVMHLVNWSVPVRSANVHQKSFSAVVDASKIHTFVTASEIVLTAKMN